MDSTWRDWEKLRRDYRCRLEGAEYLRDSTGGKTVAPERTVALLETVIRPGDRVALEGNNQKQAEFLAASLCRVDPSRIHSLHMVQSVVALPWHCELFERGIAARVDFSYAGPQAVKVMELVRTGKMKIGEIHTYLELFSRYFLDLAPRVALVVAILADGEGNLYTGANTEDTPVIVEATHFRHGIVVAQVERVVEKLPRVDIPGDWVDFVVPSGKPCYMEPLFTRDPARLRPNHILMAMMVIKGIYEPYMVRSLNHGIGYATAAIELLLPTYAAALGLRGKVCTHWVLNPHPTLIPAIEMGFVESVATFGSEVGMEDYVAARPDIFPVGPDGNLRSNRALCQALGHYSIDAFVGATLQMDRYGNSSTAVAGRIAGFGGAPNMGCNPPGRRHSSLAWLKAGQEDGMVAALTGGVPRGRKLVVQLLETRGAGGEPAFVDRLDAWALREQTGLEVPPVMIYGDAITHVVTEQGIAHIHRCTSLAEREAAIGAVSGDTVPGRRVTAEMKTELRLRGLVQTPADLGIDPAAADQSFLAARSLADLVRWSGGLYRVPQKFR